MSVRRCKVCDEPELAAICELHLKILEAAAVQLLRELPLIARCRQGQQLARILKTGGVTCSD